jgi:DNA repair exonuclease SbcCD ATPase subunit
MLVLKSLTFSGIGRFVEEQVINFDTLGSLIQVEGENRNTGGSSGSGKSTLFKALEFLLGLNDISNGILQSRLTKSPMSVVGLFELDGVPLRIERDKKLLIDLGGEVTTGSSKLSEEKLDQILGMPRELFRKILVKRQGEQGFFLNMTASESHKFLTSCLGLEKEQAKISTLETKLLDLTKNEISLKSAVESYKSALQATETAISSLGLPPALEIAPERLEELKTKHLGAVDTHKLVKSSHKTEMDDLEKSRPQIVTTPFDRTQIEQLEMEIGTVLAEIASLEKVEFNRQSTVKAKISELQIQAIALNNTETARQNDVKAKISAVRMEIQKLEALEQSRRSEVQTRYNANSINIIKASAESTDGSQAKTAAIGLAEELKKIRASICPTCEQGWVNDAAKTKEADVLTKLQDCKKRMIAGTAADTRLLVLEEEKKQLISEAKPQISAEVNGYNEQLAQLELDKQPKSIPELANLKTLATQYQEESKSQVIPEAIELKLKIDFKNQELTAHRQKERDHQFNENTKQQQILAIFSQKQTALRQSHETTLKFVQDEESKALSAYTEASNKVDNFEQAKSRFEESHKKLSAQISMCHHKLELQTTELAAIQEEIELATEAKKAIKSYLSCSFEDALDSIGDAATRLIRGIPNMATSTVQFEGLKETKEGKIKEEVTCLISMDGEIGIPVKSLSGGERSAVDIGIDLAVIKFIEERTGKGIDLWIGDEIFNGLDTTCIEDAIEMLKNCSLDKRLFLVEHNPIIAQAMENRITVIRDGLTSKVVQG